MDMTTAEIQAIRALRSRGFVVVIFSPDELDGTSEDRDLDHWNTPDPGDVEDRLVELGWDVIESAAAIRYDWQQDANQL